MMKTSSHDFYFRVYGTFPALGKENSSPRESKHVARIYLISRIHLISRQGGRCTPKKRSPNLCYFAAKLGFVTIYALFEKLSESFQWNSDCFQRALAKNSKISRNHRKEKILSQKFANAHSLKALRDSVALAKSQPASVTLYLGYISYLEYIS